jgi:hypothetical protein
MFHHHLDIVAFLAVHAPTLRRATWHDVSARTSLQIVLR